MNKLFANSAKFYIGSLSIADFAVFYESWNQSPVKSIHCFYCLRCSRNVSLSLVKLRMYRKIFKSCCHISKLTNGAALLNNY